VRRGGCDPCRADDWDRNTSDWRESNRKMSQVYIFFGETNEAVFRKKNRMDNRPLWSDTQRHDEMD